ncbi:MAG: DUF488 family protein [Sphingomonas bacterium]
MRSRREQLDADACPGIGGWRNKGFRGNADHMQSLGFREAVAAAIHVGREARIAIMCVEAAAWRCHRLLIAIVEILSQMDWRMRRPAPFAQVDGTPILCPPDQPALS